ncbi:NAD(P)/FAD-dependent oxidoreductase [Paraburkholderia oxyphila]|uniref:NAD(P)/FAD-dependent oxidoreductase n=1 Tax=Paraburkholderia oxyphila TaxID=614212 RepID=UPI0004893EDF|nr:FAD-dependent oxidoreductase [Paraburkholderia oxyphila]
MEGPIVIVGGGHAAAQLCASLAEHSLGSRVHLVSAENCLPYHRPPLSKTFLTDPDPKLQLHLSEDWYRNQGVSVNLGDPAVDVIRSGERRKVITNSGQCIEAQWVVLATGAVARTLPTLGGQNLANVVTLRGYADACRLRQQLEEAQRILIIGGGYIGLEVAASARKLNKEVVLLEAAPRLLNRASSDLVAAYVQETHQRNGIDIRVAVGEIQIETSHDRASAAIIAKERLSFDLLVVGIGATPVTDIASRAGLACDDGILVDASMRTIDPYVLAIGDCARVRTNTGRDSRLESVHTASEQAQAATATITGAPGVRGSTPWFWSDQGTVKLQIAGRVSAIGQANHRIVRRTGRSSESFAVAHYLGDVLVGVESVNAPVEHVLARRLLDEGLNLPADAFADPAFAIKAWITEELATRGVTA